jgi:hypothetical protein
VLDSSAVIATNDFLVTDEVASKLAIAWVSTLDDAITDDEVDLLSAELESDADLLMNGDADDERTTAPDWMLAALWGLDSSSLGGSDQSAPPSQEN